MGKVPSTTCYTHNKAWGTNISTSHGTLYHWGPVLMITMSSIQLEASKNLLRNLVKKLPELKECIKAVVIVSSEKASLLDQEISKIYTPSSQGIPLKHMSDPDKKFIKELEIDDEEARIFLISEKMEILSMNNVLGQLNIE